MRLICAVVLVVGLAMPAHAQDEPGWSFSGSFNGSANSAGVITKAEPMLGYRFGRHFSTYAGLPFYFVNLKSSTTTTEGFMSGLGNAFLGFRANVDSEVVNYTSNLEFTAPTGDKARGFSTGRMTVDWTNRFSHRFSSFTPFGSAGIANTVSDTSFFVRPFSSLGVIGHFEGGAMYDVSRAVRLGASAYAVRGSGQQRIISKVIRRDVVTTASSNTSSTASTRRDTGSRDTGAGDAGNRGRGTRRDRVFETQVETVSQADIVNDHGYSAWFGVSPRPEVDFHAGYSRSVNYDFNTFFFGVGFHVGK
jgi:hypothetical protein